MNKTIRKILYTFLLTILSFCLLLAIGIDSSPINKQFHISELLHETEQIFYDICWKIKFRIQYNEVDESQKMVTLDYREDRIQLIDIDEISFAELGRYRTWPRTYHGKIVEELKKSGAAVTAFDILFKDADFGNKKTSEVLEVLNKVDPNYPWATLQNEMKNGFNHDSILVESVRKAGNVISAGQMNPLTAYNYTEERQKLFSEKRRLEISPESSFPKTDWGPGVKWDLLDNIFPELASASHRMGLINVEPDADGVHRRVPLLHEFPNKENDSNAIPHLYPVLSLQVVLYLTGHEPSDLIVEPGEQITIGKPLGIYRDSAGVLQTTYPQLTYPMITRVIEKKDKIQNLGPENKLVTVSPLLMVYWEDGEKFIDILDGQTILPKYLEILCQPHFDSLYFSINAENPEIELSEGFRLYYSEDEGTALFEDTEAEEEFFFDRYTLSLLKNNRQRIENHPEDAFPLYLSSVLDIHWKNDRIHSDFIILNQSVLRDLFHTGVPKIEALSQGDTLRFGDPIQIPIDSRGRALINYLGKYDVPSNQKTFPNISYSKLVNNKVQGVYQGKIFVMGSSAHALFDMVSAPDEKNYPGVYLHMNLIENFLNNNFIRLLNSYWLWFLVFLFCALTAIFSMLLSPYLTLIGLSFVGLAYLIVNYYTFRYHGTYMGILLPELALGTTYLLAMLVRYFIEEREKRQINSAFKQYISPELIDQMVDSGSKPELGGQESYITAFFTDIASFSTFSERIGSASKLVDLLNEYLSAMTEILSERQGTLDKYIGDAIVAFFGAPAPLKNHAKAAFDTAIAMQKRLDQLRDKWAGEGEKWPVIVHHMRMRIGINSGSIVTGNMGSKMRKNYTMMGDPVNLAARLESGAKQYGVYTLVSREALEAAGPQDYEYRQIDKVRVVGKSLPVETFELFDHFATASPEVKQLCTAFEKGRQAYNACEWEKAIAFFEQCLPLEPFHPSRTPGSKTTPSHVYIERCKAYQEHPPVPPGEPWDGVYIATSK